MALARKSVLHLAVLALVAQICTSQHWSYGWLPGGKRSINELQASLEVCTCVGICENHALSLRIVIKALRLFFTT
ncbi:progonadoliberin-3 isoform X1 [Huso huso]|uniref:Progonadoliberin n=1 Tax=Huso huso TaxID=61971 RepID=A0ABR0ZBM5_HUSHU